MLLIVINWLYVLFTTFCLGYAFSEAMGKCTSCRLKTMDAILMAGMICSTVYAQFFSLFYRVSMAANIILLVLCGGVILAFRGRMWSDIKRAWSSCSVLVKVLIPVLFLVWAYCASRGYMPPDTQGYHAQSIRWIEEYGIVPGQAVLNFRFSYNSSMFALSALYSLKFLFGQSMHAMCGWIAFLLSITVLDVIKGRKRLRWSDFANAAAIYYLTTICDEVVAPSSDYPSMCLIFYIVIKWVRLLEQLGEEQKTPPYAYLCVLGVYALTMKLTAGLILLLLLKPAYELIRDKKWREILLYLALGLTVAVPWMIRSVLLSGWLIYPLYQLDLFDVAWKQKIPWIEFDVAGIKTWARGLDTTKLDMPIREWFMPWFRSVLDGTQKLFILGDIAAVVLSVPYALWIFLKKRWEKLDGLLVTFVVVCSYLYWQLSAPLPRYGYAHMLLVPALVFGNIVLAIKKDFVVRACLALYGAYKLYVVAAYLYSACWGPYYIYQQEYQNASRSVYTIEVGGITFYESDEEDLGYDYFPGGRPAFAEFRLRGEDLKDGFELLP